MKKTVIVSLTLFAAVSFGAAVSIVETELEFPTYGFSDPDPVPRTDSPLYPYFRFDGSTAEPTAQKWKAVILENEKIRVTMLPEIGGKVWGAQEIATGHAFIYYNHAVKFRNIALRGPWCSGGIEFNFAITGHAPTSATPVDWYVRKNEDGSASYFAGASEYIGRTIWQVEVRLAPGDDHFTMRTIWFNGANLTGPYYQWMNAAFPLFENTDFFFPGKNYIGHPGDAHAWPIDDAGRDLSVYAQNRFGSNKSYHVLNGDNSVFGIWWPDIRFGAVHRNPVYDKYGRKIWLWSPSRAGAIWETLLTDKDGQYAELQSGRAFQQPRPPCEKTPFKVPSFAPGGTDVFDEMWSMVKNREAFGTPEIGVKPRPIEMPSDFDWNSVQGLYLKGTQKLRYLHDDDGAARLLRSALAIDNHFAPALVALAGLEAKRAHYAEAARLAERALAVDTYDGEANYLAGFAAFAQDDLATAKERLGLAAFSPMMRSASYSLLSKIMLREKNWQEAALLADRALCANGLSFDALLAKVIALRKGGDIAAATASAKATLAQLPLFHAVRYELGKLGGKEDFRAYIKCELPHETFMDLGTWYEAAGLADEARELFGFAGDHPVARIRLAYLERDAAALNAIAKLSAEFVFPFRRESLPALEWAARENSSWKFKYYHALFLAANGEQDRADALLAACGNAPDLAAFYLFRAGRRLGAAGDADIARAIELGGGWRAELRGNRLTADSEVNPMKLAYAKSLLDAKRYRECVDYLAKSVILPSEFGDNANDIWRAACYALGENEKAESYPENLGAGKPYPQDNRPYEFKNANRTLDDVPALVDFEDDPAWKVRAENAAALCATTRETQLFGEKTLRLSYCGKGDKPSIAFGPEKPVAVTNAWNTFAVWVHGDHFGRGANTQPEVPSAELFLALRLADGTEQRVSLGKITWPDWHRIERRFSPEETKRFQGAAFAGFVLTGGTQPEYRPMHFDNIAFFMDTLSGKLDIAARAKRNLTPLKGADQGINTGDRNLPFPTTESTIIPRTSSPQEGDLIATFNGGAIAGSDTGKLEVTTSRRGKSLVVDLYAPAGTVTEVSSGTATEAKVLKSFIVPYLAYGIRQNRLKIDLLEGGWYRSAIFDWYRSNASEVSNAGNAQSMRYYPKTDGTYNPVSERIVITLSRDFAEVLPEIPNPVSPYKTVAGKGAWRSHGSYVRKLDKAFWREVKKLGIDHVIVTDHETLWRDRGESFTCRTDAAPGKGGDAGAEDYSRFMREELGYVYGPYNNFTDFSPMNAIWSRDLIARQRDGSFYPAWFRCYGPKPALAPMLCERFAPELKRKFGYNTAYCDVHTTLVPWSRTDYDARVPGAATFAQTFYAYGETLLLQKQAWQGPVYSEGGHHFFYSGLSDGNYAQDRGYNFFTMPWIVDFDLLKIHPKECNFGMGLLPMFSPGKMYQPNTEPVGGIEELVDCFLTAVVAFGHAPHLILDYCFTPSKPFGLAYCGPGRIDFEKGIDIALRSYAMVQPLAARYTQSDVSTIAYLDADGKAHASSAAIADGTVERNQVFVEYQDGTVIVANGNLKERLKTKIGDETIDLPPRAFKGWTRDGKVTAEISENADGKRVYFCDCPEFTYKGGKLIKKP